MSVPPLEGRYIWGQIVLKQGVSFIRTKSLSFGSCAVVHGFCCPAWCTALILVLALVQKESFKIEHGTFERDGQYKRTDVRQEHMSQEQVSLRRNKRKRSKIR